MRARFLPLGLCLLFAVVARAEAGVEISASLTGFNIVAAVGDDSLTTAASAAYAEAAAKERRPDMGSGVLPRVTTKDGELCTIRVVREWPHATMFDKEGTPTEFETVNLGVTLRITPYPSADGVRFFGSLELVEREVLDGKVPGRIGLRSAKTVFDGSGEYGKTIVVPIATPKGKGMLTLRFKGVKP